MASIRKRGSNFQLRCTVNGKRTEVSWKPPTGLTPRQAEKMAQKEADALEDRLRSGIVLTNISFRDFGKTYLDHISATQKQTTIKAHAARLKIVDPYIGDIPVRSINKMHIRNLVAALQKPYTKYGKEHARSAETVKDYIKTVSCVMSYAETRDIIDRNPCIGKGIVLPSKDDTAEKILSPKVLSNYMAAMETAPLTDKVFFHLMLTTGCRRGELCALRWQDVDLENGEINIVQNAVPISGLGTVFQTPKTATSQRKLSIPVDVCDMLRQLLLEQKENRLRAGRLWQKDPDDPSKVYCAAHGTCDHPCYGFCSRNCHKYEPSDHVFINQLGCPRHPQTALHNFQRIGRENNLPKATLHELRHCYASILIQNGESLTDISRALGHSSPQITMSTYLHAFQERDKAIKLATDVTDFLQKNA